MTNILIYSLFILFSLGQLGRVALISGQVNFYFFEALMVLMFPLLILRLGFLPLVTAFKKFKVVCGFYFVLSVSYLFGISGFTSAENGVAALYFLRLIFYPLFMFYLFGYFAKDKKSGDILKRGFNISIFLFAVSSLIQYFLYPDLRNLMYQGWDPHLNRLFGVFFDTGLAASFYGMVSLYFLKKKIYIPALVFMALLIMTFSRSAYLFFFLVLILELLWNRRFKLFIAIAAVFVLVFALLPKQFGVGVGLDRLFSITSRTSDYSSAFDLAMKAPVFGHGYNRIRFIRDDAAVVNPEIPRNSASSFSSSYLIILVTGGILGLALFVISLYKIAGGVEFPPYLTFVLLMSFADNILLHPFVMFGLGSMIAISHLSYKSR